MSTETQPGSPHPSSAATADAIAATRKNNTRGKVLTASMVGTTIEFFDFYAYATASSLVFPALFFPNQTSTTQLLSSLAIFGRSEEHTSELQSRGHLVCRLLLEKKICSPNSLYTLAFSIDTLCN